MARDELVERCKLGDTTGYEKLYRQYVKAMYTPASALSIILPMQKMCCRKRSWMRFVRYMISITTPPSGRG